MNDRERFLACMRYDPVDRLPYRPQGFWGATLDRWRSEGMPAGVSPAEHFGFDTWRNLPVNIDMLPLFEERVVEQHDTWHLMVDKHGITKKSLSKNSELSMPEFVDFPVKTAGDFCELKHRYDPADAARYPADWDRRVEAWRDRDFVLGLDLRYGLYMVLREWMGPEGLLYAFLDQPKLVHEMLEFYTEFLVRLLERALRDVEVDYVSFSEDMAYKGGPFVSPAMFREFFFPHYRRLGELIRGHGVETFAVDSDGYPDPLIPPLMEAGVNCIHPCEVAAGMDVVQQRADYGRELRLWCGIDKRVLARDEAAIDAELEARVRPMKDSGGYIPQIDHSVPPDVPYGNFCYYWDRLQEMAR